MKIYFKVSKPKRQRLSIDYYEKFCRSLFLGEIFCYNVRKIFWRGWNEKNFSNGVYGGGFVCKYFLRCRTNVQTLKKKLLKKVFTLKRLTTLFLRELKENLLKMISQFREKICAICMSCIKVLTEKLTKAKLFATLTLFMI